MVKSVDKKKKSKKNAPVATVEDMSSDETIEDNGSSAEEEAKVRSLQKMKATLPSSFDAK